MTNDTPRRPRAYDKGMATEGSPDPRKHWESVYSAKATTEVSWYQSEATLSHELIRKVAPDRSSAILDVGGGASTLVDSLVEEGYSNVGVLDIASNALDAAKARLGPAAGRVRWLTGNVLDADIADHTIDVWHDRAVFHFLLSADDRGRYVGQVRRTLRPGGHVIIATFAEDGPEQCSGLHVARYDAAQMQAEFGPDFELLDSIREEHTTPSGKRQSFRYCIFAYAIRDVPLRRGPFLS